MNSLVGAGRHKENPKTFSLADAPLPVPSRLRLGKRVGACAAPDLLHDQVELDRPPDAVVPADHVVHIARFDEISGRTLRTDSEEMRRDCRRLHAGDRKSTRLNSS